MSGNNRKPIPVHQNHDGCGGLVIVRRVSPSTFVNMQRHKSLEAWRSAHVVVSGVFDTRFAAPSPRAYPIYDQLRRSALSVQLNIAEGYGAQSARVFRRHLVIAYGSALETGDLLELIIEKALGPESMARNLLAEALRTQRLLLGLIQRYTPRG